jgi:hypothetical protein
LATLLNDAESPNFAAPSGKLADLSREVSREEVCASAQLGWLAQFTPFK